MSIDVATVAKESVEWVVNWNEGELGDPIGPETQLLASGALDSMGLVGFVAYLEDRLDVEFDYAEFDLTGDVSVQAIIAHALRDRA
jgi:acyl carrier protein